MTTPSVSPGRIPTWSLGDRVRKARESANLEQSELATLSGVSRQSISMIENGASVRPRRSTIVAIAFATGVSLEWLETGHAPGGPTPDSTEPPTEVIVSIGGRKWAIRDSNPEPAD